MPIFATICEMFDDNFEMSECLCVLSWYINSTNSWHTHTMLPMLQSLKPFTVIVFLSRWALNRIGQFSEQIYETYRCNELRCVCVSILLDVMLRPSILCAISYIYLFDIWTKKNSSHTHTHTIRNNLLNYVSAITTYQLHWWHHYDRQWTTENEAPPPLSYEWYNAIYMAPYIHCIC